MVTWNVTKGGTGETGPRQIYLRQQGLLRDLENDFKSPSTHFIFMGKNV